MTLMRLAITITYPDASSLDSTFTGYDVKTYIAAWDPFQPEYDKDNSNLSHNMSLRTTGRVAGILAKKETL